MADRPTRPVLRWFGGKWLLADWIISHFPRHRVYVEPYGGAASVLLKKERSYGEVWNDLDEEVVSLFRVLRSDRLGELCRLLEYTPFARAEFMLSYVEATGDPVEAARRLIVRSFMGFGANAHASTERGHRSTGFRAASDRSGTTPAHDWMNYPDALLKIAERLRGIVIENRPALQVMAQHDSVDTLIYADPPYPLELRARGNPYDAKWRMYRHEMTTADHFDLLKALLDLKGMVILSGYDNEIYNDALRGWAKVSKQTYADGARERTEVLWLNPQAVGRHRGDMPLFKVQTHA